MSLITIWKGLLSTKEPFYITPETAIDRIRSGKNKDLIEKIRKNPKSKSKNKEKLPAYSWSGTFTERKDSALIQHSGYLAIDFDHCENIEQLRARIQRDKYTYSCFLSPGGDGLKMIVKIPPDPASHKLHAKAIADYYCDEPSLDKVFDISRLCFDSWDPDIYVNENSEVWERIYQEKEPCPVNIIKNALADNAQIYINLKKWLSENGVHFIQGNRHLYVFRLTAACNRFGIPLEVALPLLIAEFAHQKDFTVEEIEKSAIRTYRNYSNQYNTSHFDDNGIKRDNRRHDVTLIIDDILMMDEAEKDIITLDSIKDQMLSHYHSGYDMGETTHFPDIDSHFRLMRKNVVVFHGIGNHGKSTFAYQIALNKSVFKGTKWAIFSPEQDPATYFYDDLVQSYLGKPSNRSFINRSTEEEYNTGMAFIADHFYYVYPDSERPTPDYIFKLFTHLITVKKVDGVIIDPFNQLDHDWENSKRDDKYLSTFLARCKKFANHYNVYFWIVAHPKGDVKRLKDSLDYERPNVYNLAGGGMWVSKVDDIICIHRPVYYSDPQSTLTEVTSQKIKKQKLCGIPGTVEFQFDRVKNRYYCNGYNPLDTEKDMARLEEKDAPFNF